MAIVELQFCLTGTRNPSQPNPVRLCVQGIEFFGRKEASAPHDQSDVWLSLHVPFLATYGLAAINVANEYGRSVIDLDDYAGALLLRREGDDVRFVTTIGGDAVVILPLADLHHAWSEFRANAFAAFSDKFPGIDQQAIEWNVPRAEAELRRNMDDHKWAFETQEVKHLFPDLNK